MSEAKAQEEEVQGFISLTLLFKVFLVTLYPLLLNQAYFKGAADSLEIDFAFSHIF